jgi:hypothetical protein
MLEIVLTIITGLTTLTGGLIIYIVKGIKDDIKEIKEQMNRRFDKVDSKFDKMDSRIESEETFSKSAIIELIKKGK